jgi:hypothetical protein
MRPPLVRKGCDIGVVNVESVKQAIGFVSAGNPAVPTYI